MKTIKIPKVRTAAVLLSLAMSAAAAFSLAATAVCVSYAEETASVTEVSTAEQLQEAISGSDISEVVLKADISGSFRVTANDSLVIDLYDGSEDQTHTITSENGAAFVNYGHLVINGGCIDSRTGNAIDNQAGTLELNGTALNSEASASAAFSADGGESIVMNNVSVRSEHSRALFINNVESLVVTEGEFLGNYRCAYIGGSSVSFKDSVLHCETSYAIYLEADASAVLDNCTVESESCPNGGDYNAVTMLSGTSISFTDGSVSCSDGDVIVITEAKLEADGTAFAVGGEDASAVRAMNAPTDIDNCTISADGGASGITAGFTRSAVNIDNSSINVNGTSGTAMDVSDGAKCSLNKSKIVNRSEEAAVKVSGGSRFRSSDSSIDSENGYCIAVYGDGNRAQINGGMYISDKGIKGNGQLSISEGVFSFRPSERDIAGESRLTQDGDNWIISTNEADVVRTAEQLAAAVEGEESEVHLKLGADIDLTDLSSSTVRIPENRSVSIDLNGYEIENSSQLFTVSGCLKLSNGTLTSAENSCIAVQFGGKADLADLSIVTFGKEPALYLDESAEMNVTDCDIDAAGCGVYAWGAESNIDLKNVRIDAMEGNAIDIDYGARCTVESGSYTTLGKYAALSITDADCTVRGGEFGAQKGHSAYIEGQEAVLTVTAGVFTDRYGIQTEDVAEDAVLLKGGWYKVKPIVAPADGYTVVYSSRSDVYKVISNKIKSIKLPTTSFTYTGSSIRPSVNVYNVLGGRLTEAKDYTVRYTSSIGVGYAKLTVTGKGKYAGSGTSTYRIIPKGTKIKSRSKRGTTLKVRWVRQSVNTSGYQLRCSTSKSFKSNVRTKTIKGRYRTYAKITKLKKGKRYYVKVRTYKTVDGVRFYSKWSAVTRTS